MSLEGQVEKEILKKIRKRRAHEGERERRRKKYTIAIEQK
jgi:hypothetical protein